MATSAIPEKTRQRSKARAGNAYFYWMSVALLALVLFGFAPTFYLRAFFDTPPIPGYLYLHGTVLTAWFGWLAFQAHLVRSRNTATHRKMGWIGAGIAAAVVLAAPMADVGLVGRLRAEGLDWTTDMSALPFLGVEGVPMLNFAANVVWGNIAMVVAFTVLFVAAVAKRKVPETHKRLVMLASFAIIAPAVARISRYAIFGGEDGPLLPLSVLFFPLTLVAHDLIRQRKIHPATLAGVAVIAVTSVAQMQIAGTEFGHALVKALA